VALPRLNGGRGSPQIKGGNVALPRLKGGRGSLPRLKGGRGSPQIKGGTWPKCVGRTSSSLRKHFNSHQAP